MTKRYLGNIITQNPTAPAGDFAISAAKGVWSLEEQLAYQKAGLWPVAGNFPLNVEDVFSTYLYEGNGGTNTITNGIDLAGEGGLVWLKDRSAANGHRLYDSERDSVNPSSFAKPALQTNGNNANLNYQDGVTTFNSNGFVIKDLSGAGGTQGNTNGNDITSWTFRKAPKFFDVVTYTGDGAAGRTVSHNLGSVPGMILVKQTNAATIWPVYHKGVNGGTNPENYLLYINGTAAQIDNDTYWNDTAPTDSVFTVGTNSNVNASGGTYVAYLFAHNDGDGVFGPNGNADAIKCGSYTGNGSTTGPVIDLGFEPQWLLIRNVDRADDWVLIDSMRGIPSSSDGPAVLRPESSAAEYASGSTFSQASRVDLTATGFDVKSSNSRVNGGSQNMIYIAIRRPTAVPESATDVFEPIEWSYSSNGEYTLSNLDYMDTFWHKRRDSAQDHMRYDRLRGTTTRFRTDAAQEITDTNSWATLWDNMNKFKYVSSAGSEWQGNQIGWAWKRAPKFFDVVAFNGGGAGDVVSHNLGVKPDLMIYKRRSANNDWIVYNSIDGANYAMFLNLTDARESNIQWWNNTEPTATNFTTGSKAFSGSTYMAYLFASLDGISKVGSVSHTEGSNTDVDCGFSAGARFVLLKGANIATGWLVFDSTRGIISGNSPTLILSSTSAEDSSQDRLDPYSSGFSIGPDVGTGTWIYYAIA